MTLPTQLPRRPARVPDFTVEGTSIWVQEGYYEGDGWCGNVYVKNGRLEADVGVGGTAPFVACVQSAYRDWLGEVQS